MPAISGAMGGAAILALGYAANGHQGSNMVIDGNTIGQVVAAIPVVISAASAAASVLPQGKPGTAWYVIRQAIDFLAFNFGNAANAKK